MSSEPAYAVFIVVVVILIIGGGLLRRRNAIRRMREQQEQERNGVDTENMGRTFYQAAAGTGGMSLNSSRPRPPAAVRLNTLQPEEDKPEEYLPPYQPPSKPLADPPAYSEATTAGPSTITAPERVAHA
ncbi:hypothetical protein FB645_003158 [Coemansia sp. IMI 203386]|nr:hypothetical protein FB645_003158 [Coemansia sp. IMI 203386]